MDTFAKYLRNIIGRLQLCWAT